MSKLEWAFRNRTGVALHAVRYQAASQPKAVMVFHHGYGEHVSRYDGGALSAASTRQHCRPLQSTFMRAVFLRLAAEGIEVRSYDARGHGCSEPNPAQRCKLATFTDIVDDLEAFCADATGTHST